MIKGIVKNPRVGKKYKMYLASNESIEVVYEGFSDSMAQKWKNTDTGETFTNFPAPIVGYDNND